MITFIPYNRANAISDGDDSIGSTIFSTENNVVECVFTTCMGTNDNDIILGSISSEEIIGLNGDDKIQGNGGNDTIYGDKNDDIISGGTGFDKLFGGDGNDVLIGDSTTSLADIYIGNEMVTMDTLNDLILGENSALSSLSSETINELNNTRERSSSIVGIVIDKNLITEDIQLLDGGKGDDYLLGQNSDEFFIGGPGNDYFDCNEGIDIVLDFNANEDTVNSNCEVLE